MSDVTVEQFAEVLKVTVDKLLAQLEEAGIKSLGPKDRISEDAKHELLTHLRKAHGKAEDGSAPRKITLRRKAQSEIKVAAPMGKARTVSVEVRRQRTYIKRDVLEEQARVAQEVLDQQREAENAEKRGCRAVTSPRGRAARPAAPRTRGIRAPHGRGGVEAPGRGAGATRGRTDAPGNRPRRSAGSARRNRARPSKTTRARVTAARSCTSRAGCRPGTRRGAPVPSRAAAPPMSARTASTVSSCPRSRCSTRLRSGRRSRSPSSPSAWR